MKLVNLNAGVVTDVNCNGASVEAPDWVETGDTFRGDTWTKGEARQQAESYAAALNNGYQDEVLGVKLKTTQNAQTVFTSMLTGLREGLDLGAITNDTQIVIWDYTDQAVSLTVLQVRQLMFRYFLHCQQFFNDYAP